VPTCFWRSVGPGHNISVVESFVDELAHAAGQDPAAFRRAHLAKDPRLLACLNLAAEKAGGGSALPARVGRGVACQSVFGSYVAAIVEAEVDSEGEIAIRRVMAVVDCGTVVNPDSVEAQIQGGLIFGLTAAFYNEIIIAKRSEIGPKTRSRITSLRDTPRGEAQQQGRWAKRSTSASWI
jgi:isoquinoline 1-oxidoreductase beta subunit